MYWEWKDEWMNRQTDDYVDERMDWWLIGWMQVNGSHKIYTRKSNIPLISVSHHHERSDHQHFGFTASLWLSSWLSSWLTSWLNGWLGSLIACWIVYGRQSATLISELAHNHELSTFTFVSVWLNTTKLSNFLNTCNAYFLAEHSTVAPQTINNVGFLPLGTLEVIITTTRLFQTTP